MFSLDNAVRVLEEKLPNGRELLSSKPEYYIRAANEDQTPLAAKVNMALNSAVSHKYRLDYASHLVGRYISSTKELTVAEAVAIWNSRKNPKFIQYGRKEFPHE